MNTLQVKDIEELQTKFVNHELGELPTTIQIGQVVYNFSKSSGDVNIKDMIDNNQKSWVVYVADASSRKILAALSYDVPEEEANTVPQTVLMLGWHIKNLMIKPAKCIYSSISRVIHKTVTEGEQRHIIGTTVKLSFPQLNDNTEYDGKIDTGAEQCCLHATDIKDSSDSISFVFGKKRYTMNKHSSVDIQSADGGVNARPVVALDVKCGDVTLQGVEFNLNDRSDMPDKILIGKNLLQKGNFLIDPLKEMLDNDLLNLIAEQEI